MGYPLNLFLTKNWAEAFKCPVCHQVPKDPKILSDDKDIMYCSSCIPQITRSSDGSTQSIQSPAKYMLNLVGRLCLHCPFKAKGCIYVNRLDLMSAHEAQCAFNEMERSIKKVQNPNISSAVQIGTEELQANNAQLTELVQKLKSDVDMYKNEAEAMHGLCDKLKSQLKMKEAEVEKLSEPMPEAVTLNLPQQLVEPQQNQQKNQMLTVEMVQQMIERLTLKHQRKPHSKQDMDDDDDENEDRPTNQDLEDLREELETATGDVDDLKTEMSDLRDELETANDDLKTKLDSTNDQVEELKNNLEETNQEMAKMVDQNCELTTQLEGMAAQNCDLIAQLTGFQTQLEEIQKKLQLVSAQPQPTVPKLGWPPNQELEGKRILVHTSGAAVYLILNGTRTLIPNDEIYSRLFKDRSGIMAPDRHIADKMASFDCLSDDSSLARSRDDSKVYLVSGGRKRLIGSRAAMDKYHFDINRVIDVTTTWLNKLPLGQPIL